MSYYDDKLRTLREQIERQRHLNTVLNDLLSQRDDLSAKVRQLDEIRLKEESDVKDLEGKSLKKFYYNVVGKLDEQLTKERREAYEASVKYENAKRELDYVIGRIEECQKELHGLNGCQEEYAKILEEKAKAIKAGGNESAKRIKELEEAVIRLNSQLKELGEAITAGNQALDTARYISDELDSAKDLSTLDIFTDSFLVDMAKHSRLDDAQWQMQNLQVQLRRFKTELADVKISAEMSISIDGFLRFADYFFDGLISDWMVRDRIEQSRVQITDTITKISSVLNRLSSMEQSSREECEKRRKELCDLVTNTKL